ncbi:hypothetical protein [Streptomyces akebiae]|uniref:hypothetical protein n=1 Tax=Streptomyces akebiae TaxID=2865673 RepID=UPI002175FAA0|nr:hypothetical protein [Streptomyces akebiae]
MSSTARPAPAWTSMAFTGCPTTSRCSRAMRTRSATTDSRRSDRRGASVSLRRRAVAQPAAHTDSRTRTTATRVARVVLRGEVGRAHRARYEERAEPGPAGTRVQARRVDADAVRDRRPPSGHERHGGRRHLSKWRYGISSSRA